MEKARVLAMIQTMAEMQDSHNKHVHPEWLTQGYEYYRAVWVECAELLDHFGWKWWKKQESDLNQVKLEIVDIWHFGLSDLIRADELENAVPVLLAVSARSKRSVGAFRLAVDSLTENTLARRAFTIEPFAAVLEALPMPFAELFELYVGKNVLNNFRQDLGYKTGEYLKLWYGREDNEHLIDVLRELNCPADAVPGEVYRALQLRYPAA